MSRNTSPRNNTTLLNGAKLGANGKTETNRFHETNGFPSVNDWWALEEAEQDAYLLEAAREARTDLRTEAKEEEEEDSAEAKKLVRFLAHVTAAETDPSVRLANYTEKKNDDIIARPAVDIADDLFWATGGWPRTANGHLFAARGQEIVPLRTETELFAWLAAQIRYPISWAKTRSTLSKAEFCTYLRQTAESSLAVETLPHEPPRPGHLYLHPFVPTLGDGSALEGLLERFSPATDVDRDLMLAATLTLFSGIEPGSRPIFLIEAEQENDSRKGRGVGKSTFVKVLARLAGGYVSVQPTDDLNRVKTRLLSEEGNCKRIALLDNVKTLRLSWADLEGLVTLDWISGHRMYVGEGRRPNLLTWFITFNGPSLSKDMAQRSVIIRLLRPTYTTDWEEETNRYIDRTRWQIIGDILALLSWGKRPAEIKESSRWGTWEGAVLACVRDPAACQKEIRARQEAADRDQEEADHIRQVLYAALRDRHRDPEKEVLFFPSSLIAQIINEAKGDRDKPQRITAYLKTLSIPELSPRAGKERGWVWRGMASSPKAAPVRLEGYLRDDTPKPNDTPLSKALKAESRKQRRHG